MNVQSDIPPFADRRPLVWSYSLLHCFRDVCPHQAQARYIERNVPFVETPEIKWGNAVHAAFEKRVGAQVPLPAEMRQWECFATPFDGRGALTEAWYQVAADGMACDRFAKNKYGHGKLDLVVINGDRAFLNDWKTGNSKYEDPFELEVGAVLLKGRFPHLKQILGTYTWLKDHRVSRVYDLSDTDKTWKEIERVVQSIHRWRAEGSYPKKRSGLCPWCPRKDCANHPEYVKPLEIPPVDTSNFDQANRES